MALYLTSYGLLSNLLIRLGGLNFDFLKPKSISLGKWICIMCMDHRTKVWAKLELLFVQVVIGYNYLNLNHHFLSILMFEYFIRLKNNGFLGP